MSIKKEIVWEDYNSNYVDNIDDSDDFDDDFDEDEEGAEPHPMSGLISVMSGGNFGKMVNTPWGPFGVNNKFAPFNFYELKIAHFKGFNTRSLASFTDVMDNIDGVAVWKSLDPYCIIIGKAKRYEWAYVINAVNTALLGKQEVKNSTPTSLADEVIAENKKKNITEYTAVIFPNNNVVQITPNDEDYSEKLAQVYELEKSMAGLIIIENGQIICK